MIKALRSSAIRLLSTRQIDTSQWNPVHYVSASLPKQTTTPCTFLSRRRFAVPKELFRDNLRHFPDGRKLTAGNLIEFRKDQQLLLGLVEGQKQHKWTVYDQNGQISHVRGQEVSLVIPGQKYCRGDIAEFLQSVKSSDQKSIETAWQSMEETSEPISLTQMAQLMLNNDSPLYCYVAYALLRTEKNYFKQVSREPPLFLRMSPVEIEIVQSSRQRLQKQQAVQNAFKEAIAATLNLEYEERPAGSTWLEGVHKERIAAVKEYAISTGLGVENRNLAMESLRVCGLSPTPNGAVRLLEAIRVFRKHEPIALLRAKIEAQFPPDVDAAAKEVISSQIADLDASKRRDLTHLNTISIDDESTREIDDAISVETMPDGRYKIWTHVSDPSRWIALDSPLDLEARKRVISLYIPTGAIPVYPWNLIDECFSLRTKQKSYALSIGAILDNDGAMESYEVVPSTITTQRRLSYNEAEEAIGKDSETDIQILHKISELRNAWRQSKGATVLVLPECDVKVKNTFKEDADPEVSIHPYDRGLRSRKIVSELMILAGEVVGKLGAAHGLALPYRAQSAAVAPKESEIQALPEGPCRAAALRSRMNRGITSSTYSQPHAGLGIEAYVQITSPIRRYSDYLAHVQLKAYLRGDQLPLSTADLEMLLTTTTRVATLRSKGVTDSVNYWIADYFRRQQKDDVSWSATLLSWKKQDKGEARILIDSLGLERGMRLDRPAEPGEKLTIAVAGVDVLSGSVRFEEVVNNSGKLSNDA